MSRQKNTQLLDNNFLRKITVIIPVLNEERNVILLIRKIKKLYPEISIIFVDDGSKDKTRELIKNFSKKDKSIKLIDRSNEKIKGLCISAIEGILKTKTEYFVVMDGDLQHPPETILNFAKKFKQDYRFVVGCRKKVKNWKIQRKFISKTAEFLGKISLTLKRKKYPKDILSGFFGGKTTLFKEIINNHKNNFQLRGYKILFDFLKVLPQNIEISEIFYNFGARKIGKSKIKLRHILFFLKGLF